MEKCRICLECRKRMHSVYDSMEGLSITYADMIASISNVKVTKINGIPDKACLACCKRLKDTYDFRCLIERSDIELQKICQIKRIVFTNIQDIKCEVELTESVKKDTMQLDNITEKLYKCCKKSLNYNGTTIRKGLARPDKKTLSVKEFLESIRDDPDNEFDIVYDVSVDFDPESGVEDDEDYTPIEKYKNEDDDDYTPIKKYKNDKKKKKLGNTDESVNKMSIKPVYLTDIRVARTPFKKRKTLHVPSQKLLHRKEMCPHCGKMVTSLKNHVLTHTGERTFRCGKCPKRFYTIHTLNTHQKKSHANRDHKCDKCVASYTTADYLKKHQLQHTGQDKKIPCEHCGKRFRTKGHLWRHCQGIHNMGTKKFSCEQCSMYFVTKSNLNHHIRVHTGERPFSCQICSQPYSYKIDFTRHCLKKHGVFLKGRPVFVMNEEVLVQERALMRDLMLRVNGVNPDDKPINPFEGPHAVKAFEQAIKALETRQIQIDLNYSKTKS